MASTAPRPLKVEHEFTDVRLTGFGGWSALALTAERLGLFGNLAEGVSVKVRRRAGRSDGESLWALVASLAAGGGALSDLDALRADPAARRLLGLRHAPSGRRMGEFLAKGSEADLDGLLEAAWRLAGRVAPVVIEHGVAARGWVPVFVDGTEIVGCGRPGGCIRAGSTRRTAGGSKWSRTWFRCCPRGRPFGFGRTTPTTVGASWSVAARKSGTARSASRTPTARPRCWRSWKACRSPPGRTSAFARRWCWCATGRMDGSSTPTSWSASSSRAPKGTSFPSTRSSSSPGTTPPLAELVRRHRGKQGQENAFKGPLRDLDPHHPPCRKLLANQVFYACGQLAQMLLRAVQFNLLPKSARKHGLRPLIRHFIRTVARLVKAAGRRRLDFAKSNLRLDWIYRAAVQLK